LGIGKDTVIAQPKVKATLVIRSFSFSTLSVSMYCHAYDNKSMNIEPTWHLFIHRTVTAMEAYGVRAFKVV